MILVLVKILFSSANFEHVVCKGTRFLWTRILNSFRGILINHPLNEILAILAA